VSCAVKVSRGRLNIPLVLRPIFVAVCNSRLFWRWLFHFLFSYGSFWSMFIVFLWSLATATLFAVMHTDGMVLPLASSETAVVLM